MKLVFAIVIAAGAPLIAGENVVLSSGLRIHIDRHEVLDGGVRLYNHDGAIELPAASVLSFEADDYVPPIPVPAISPEVPLPVTAPDSRAVNPKEEIRAAAVRSGLPRSFVESVAKAESAFNPRAVSPKGAIGVMQLMPDTARSLGADAHDTQQNIDAGTRLLRELLLKYDGDVAKALSAYNAGEKAVDRYQGIPPYPETQRYVNRVVLDYLRQDKTESQENTGSSQ